MKIFIAVFVSFFLSACGTAKVITASEQGIAVDVGGTEWTTSEMLKKGAVIANDHCAKFGKKANFDSTSGFLGAATMVHFSCR